MNKVAEFYAKVMEEKETAAEFAEAMGGKTMNELGDAEYEKLGKLAEKLGFAISVEEAKSYLSSTEGELSDGELDAVAGGATYHDYLHDDHDDIFTVTVPKKKL